MSRIQSYGWGPEGPVEADESLCDDGGKRLSRPLRALLDKTITAANASPDSAAHISEGGHTCTVNMRAGEAVNVPRWAIQAGGAFIAGGMVYEQTRTSVEHQPPEWTHSGQTVRQRIRGAQ